MTLPAALQARLAKRGIIKSAQTEQQSQNNSLNQNSNNNISTEINNNQTEEIIAESYDDPNEENNNVNSAIQLDSGIEVEEVANCPNLSNPYHECTDYCKKVYGLKQFQHNPVMERRRIRMLKIYPLPPNWKEVPDVHTNRYYYWNVETDQVSWLSPAHPKAEITMSKKAIDLAKHIALDDENLKDDENEEEDDDNEDEDGIDEDEDDDEDEEDDNEGEEEPVQEYSKSTRSARFEEDLDEFLSSYTSDAGNNNKSKPNQSKRQKKETPLDPMDPAAYSDTPRGNWSRGLNTNDKDAADDSASGPLFQARPYPSPGQILKMNAEKK